MAETKESYDAYLAGEKPPNYKTLSGIELKQFYTADDVRQKDGVPGEYPFTRGIHQDMYRRRFWTRRQQTGFGTPGESNQRMKFLLSQGQTGLNCDPDVVTHLGLDPDYPLAEGDIGLAGTSISTLEDMEQLFDGIPLDKVSTTIIEYPPASAVMMAMYLLIARKRDIPQDKLIGTIMNDALNQLVGPTVEAVERFFPVEAGVRVGLDVMEYCVKHMPRWNILNINAYNMRETGISAVQEAAFALSLAADYIQRLVERGLSVDDFAGKIAFFCSMDIDFLEEIAKIRAMRRIWAKMLKERFGAKDLRSCWFRAAIQTSALRLTAQQPLNNIVRATIQTLAAVLAGTQSIHTTSYDEAYALPTEESHKLSIRLQQVIAYETNVTKTVDPLGGSYAIEWLTDKLEAEIQPLMRVIEDKGGFIECFKRGWVEEQVNEARYEYARRIENGQQLVVGVNVFRDEEETKIDLFKQASDMQEKRKQYIKAYKKNRDQEKVDKALDRLYQKATSVERVNLFIPILEAVEAKATTGEIVNSLRKAENFEIRL